MDKQKHAFNLSKKHENTFETNANTYMSLLQIKSTSFSPGYTNIQ